MTSVDVWFEGTTTNNKSEATEAETFQILKFNAIFTSF